MKFTGWLAVPAVALLLPTAAILIAGSATAATADNAPAPPPTPNQCVADLGDFKMHGKTPAFVITLENKCERRIRCRVFANITTARDSKRAQTTMTLAPHAQGAKAKQSYVVRVHVMGGMAQMSRTCRFI